MIPRLALTAWRSKAPWPFDALIEQDLVLSRALVEIFRDPLIRGSLAFRGGTALHKLWAPVPGRYSEDIDLVQIEAGPIGSLLDAIRTTLDPWLGVPKRKRGSGRVTLIYRFSTTSRPVQPMRLKLEINSREHFSVLGFRHEPFEVRSPWFSGDAEISTYQLDELLGTKLRALYQRKRGRDLFDLWWAKDHPEFHSERIVKCFQQYLEESDQRISRAEFEANLSTKIRDAMFRVDLRPLLSRGIAWEIDQAAQFAFDSLIALLPGNPWQGRDDGDSASDS